MSYTPKRKKKLSAKISWNQEGNKEVGVKANAEEIMYVCSRHVPAARYEIVM
jgi:hypothetical protein